MSLYSQLKAVYNLEPIKVNDPRQDVINALKECITIGSVINVIVAHGFKYSREGDMIGVWDGENMFSTCPV